VVLMPRHSERLAGRGDQHPIGIARPHIPGKGPHIGYILHRGSVTSTTCHPHLWWPKSAGAEGQSDFRDRSLERCGDDFDVAESTSVRLAFCL